MALSKADAQAIQDMCDARADAILEAEVKDKSVDRVGLRQAADLLFVANQLALRIARMA